MAAFQNVILASCMPDSISLYSLPIVRLSAMQNSFFPFCRIGILDLFYPALDFCTDQFRVFQQLNHLFPNELIQIILTDGSALAHSAVRIAVIIGAKATVIVYLSL